MVTCKEIDDYLAYAKAHPEWINTERKLLIENIVLQTLKRDDVFLTKKPTENVCSIARIIIIRFFRIRNLSMRSHLCT